MDQKLQPRHVVAIVAIIASACVLIASPARAVAGTIVNLADRTASYYAKVDSSGALRVAPVEPRTSTNLIGGVSSGLGSTRDLLLAGSGPTRFAITQITASYNTFSSTTPESVFVSFSVYHRTSGSGTCTNVENNQTTGFTLTSIRSFMVRRNETVDLSFPLRAINTPAVSSGQPWCLLFGAVNPGSLYAVYVGVTGYKF
jgi:hypothetical protein